MVAVAVFGLALGWLAERRRRFLRLAERHEARIRYHMEYPGFFFFTNIRYDTELHEKYEQAARRPWLPIAPDPAERMMGVQVTGGDRTNALPKVEEIDPFEP